MSNHSLTRVNKRKQVKIGKHASTWVNIGKHKLRWVNIGEHE